MQETELRAAVLAAPDDDAPRVAYADGIQESDPDRARFIRLQLELAALEPARTTEEREAIIGLLETIVVLEDLHGEAWAGPIADWCEAFSFHRGFVAEVTLSGEGFVDRADAVFAREPIRFLRLTSLPEPGGLDALLASPHLDGLVGLDLAGLPVGDEGISALAACPRIAGLRWLGLAGCGVRVKGARAMAASPHLRELAYVDGADEPIALSPSPVVGPDWQITGWKVPGGLKLLAKALGDRPWFYGFATTMHNHPPRWYHLLEEADDG